MRSLSRVMFVLFFVILAAGFAVNPAEAQEQCYSLASSCTYEDIRRCQDCMEAFCQRQKLDCLAFEDDGSCHANYDLCMGDGIIRCQNCGDEDHGTGTDCPTCWPWPSRAPEAPTVAQVPAIPRSNDHATPSSLPTISRLIFDLGLDPMTVCAFIQPPAKAENKITAEALDGGLGDPLPGWWVCDIYIEPDHWGFDDCYAECQASGPPSPGCIATCREWHCWWDGSY